MNYILYHILFALWYCISKLPASIHYFNSNCLYILIYYIIRYRRKLVRKNLTDSFPDLDFTEIHRIEKEFYSHLCDIFVESVMYFSMSKENLKRRMHFEGIDSLIESSKKGQSVAIYMGHYANWEWISSVSLWISDYFTPTHIYHPIENRLINKLLDHSRCRLGSNGIPIDESIRHIIRHSQSGKPIAIGFISDQTPRWNNIHLWIPFLNHPETPVFTGAERIIKKFNMAVYYLDMKQIKRGYYKAEFKLLTEFPKEVSNFKLTELYCQLLEKSIISNPSLWLWSHNRWKRTKTEWKKRYGHIQTRDYCKSDDMLDYQAELHHTAFSPLIKEAT